MEYMYLETALKGIGGGGESIVSRGFTVYFLNSSKISANCK